MALPAAATKPTMTDTPLTAPTRSSETADHDAPSLLFARYVKALALLCECQPYVDEPDYETQLDTLLREACTAYGLEMRHVDGRFEIALPGPQQPNAGRWRAACAS
jgi:hypothetical protein